MQNEFVYPKLLLFGEYSVLLNGSAISFPLKSFSAKFDFWDKSLENEQAFISNNNLIAFSTFLSNDKNLKSHISVDIFKDDLNNGMYLWSDIPIGYGIGSSGVLCASIYKKYKIERQNILDVNLISLKNMFVAMEAYFHGKSSGLDPLTSYLNTPVLMKNSDIYRVQTEVSGFENWALIDSNVERKTDSLVKLFLAKCEDSDYLKEIRINYIPQVEKIIDNINANLNKKQSDEETLQILRSISRMQYLYFDEMIPDNIKDIWQYGLDTGLYSLKLLGAGGGGFFLCYSNSWKKAANIFTDRGLKIESVKL